MARWHLDNRATDEGKARERERNLARYEREADHRRKGAQDYYWRNVGPCREYSRNYRRNNPHRRRYANEVRAERMRSNPGFTPFGESAWVRLKRQYGNACAYCGARGSLVQDHVIPLAQGGRHAIANILPACVTCNAHKGSLFLSAWKLRETYPRGR